MEANSIVWELTYAGLGEPDLLSSVRGKMLKIGHTLDKSYSRIIVSPFPACVETEQLVDQPCVVRDLPDRLVLQKPSGWEVNQTDGVSSEFLQSSGEQRKLLATYLWALFPSRC